MHYEASLAGAVVALAGLTVAQQSSLPACAQGCVTKFTSGNEIGSCANLDVTCICSNKNFLNNVACCLASVCSAADQQAAIAYAEQICSTAGVAVPSQVVCNSAGATLGSTSSTASTASLVSFASSISSAVSSAALASSATTASTAFLTTSHTSSTVSGLSVTSSTSSAASTSSTVSSTTSSTRSSTTPSTLSGTASNSSLSPGAEAGIGIGAACVVIIVVVLLLLFFRRRRRSGGGLSDQEMYSAAPMETTPEMETNANIHEISSKPVSNSAIHVLSEKLATEPPSWKNNAVEKDSTIVRHLPKLQGDLDTAKQNLAEADVAAIGQANPLMHELDGLTPLRGESGTTAAHQVPAAATEASGDSAQEMPAAPFYPAVAHEMANTTRRPVPPPAQDSSVHPQAVPKGGHAAPGPQTQAAQSPVVSEAPTGESLPLSPSGDAQSSPPAAEGSASSRLDILRTRIDRVREEKERLARLQELEHLEAELQREIMDEQRREFGTR